MARQILPIAGSMVTGHTGKLSWWRRSLIALAGVGLPSRPAKGRTFSDSTPAMGKGAEE